MPSLKIEVSKKELKFLKKQARQMGFKNLEAMMKYAVYGITGLKSITHQTRTEGKKLKYKPEEFFEKDKAKILNYIRTDFPNGLSGVKKTLISNLQMRKWEYETNQKSGLKILKTAKDPNALDTVQDMADDLFGNSPFHSRSLKKKKNK